MDLSCREVPQVITHEKVLLDCEAEFKEFVDTMDLLGAKLGPPLLQFGYFNKKAFVAMNDSSLGSAIPEKATKGSQVCRRNPKQKLARSQFVEALRERGLHLP